MNLRDQVLAVLTEMGQEIGVDIGPDEWSHLYDTAMRRRVDAMLRDVLGRIATTQPRLLEIWATVEEAPRFFFIVPEADPGSSAWYRYFLPHTAESTYPEAESNVLYPSQFTLREMFFDPPPILLWRAEPDEVTS